MIRRIVAGIVGPSRILLGLYGLASPGRRPRLRRLLARRRPPSRALAYGEARAIYGGLFAVLGGLHALGRHRPGGQAVAPLLMAGLIWLGICAGRLLGVSIDGNPGVFGWFGVVGEAALGMALVSAATLRVRLPAG